MHRVVVREAAPTVNAEVPNGPTSLLGANLIQEHHRRFREGDNAPSNWHRDSGMGMGVVSTLVDAMAHKNFNGFTQRC